MSIKLFPDASAFDRDASALNTRPAAPVEGLVTCVTLHITSTDTYPDVDVEVHDGSYIQPKDSPVAMVTKSQAEAIVAARDKEIARLQKINAMIMGDDENAPRYTTKRLKQEVERVTQVMRGEASDREAHVRTLETDNAALTARVKEVENSLYDAKDIARNASSNCNTGAVKPKPSKPNSRRQGRRWSVRHMASIKSTSL